MRAPYRVAVWGPGGLGGCAIREIAALPEFELVAVYAYSPSKTGRDAGSLVSGAANGVMIVNDVRPLLAAKPECVLYTARDQGDFSSDADILALLEAGINVVTPLPYFNFRDRGEVVRQRFIAAALKGGATFHATGISPTFMFERLGALLTGLSNRIRSVRLFEYFSIEHKEAGGAEVSKAFGMGGRKEDIHNNSRLATMTDNYFRQSIFALADALGVQVDRIERTPHHMEVRERISVPGLIDIESGGVGVVSYKWIGYKGVLPFFTYHVHWYAHSSLCPELARGHGDDYWMVEIEGNPSSRVGIELKHSLEPTSEARTSPSVPAFISTVICMLHAIPAVVEAEPGLLPTDIPKLHWKPDLRL